MRYPTDLERGLEPLGYPDKLPEDVAERLDRVVRAVNRIRDLHFTHGVPLTRWAVLDGIRELAEASDALGADWFFVLDLKPLIDGAIALADSVVEELEQLPGWAA